MTTAFRIPPAPVGQQAPPARGSLLLTKGAGYRRT
jgi:hypothetical protein